VARIPVAHIHGGETTEGAIDEAIRHSITKMSHFHFVAHDIYKKRVVQLGENPDRVFNFGTIGLDHLTRTKFMTREQLEESLEFKLGDVNFLVTYHPVTLSGEPTEKALEQLFKALDKFPKAKIIFTKSNSDTDGKVIGQKIDEYVSRNSDRTGAFVSLGQQRYLSLVSLVDVVIGNSSSGIIEVPALKKPTVNIGPRQQGRLRAASVVDCRDDAASIVLAIENSLSSEFKKTYEEKTPPYQSGDTSRRIKEVLKTVNLQGVVMKKFYDLGSL